jgi:translation initiation factor 3 subunit D
MMCANRSVYPWDIVVVRDGDKVYFDKRPNSAFGEMSCPTFSNFRLCDSQ